MRTEVEIKCVKMIQKENYVYNYSDIVQTLRRRECLVLLTVPY